MSVRLQIAGMLFLMIQAVLFGVGTIVVMTTGLADHGLGVMAAVTLGSAVLAAPLGWMLAVYLRKHEHEPHLAG